MRPIRVAIFTPSLEQGGTERQLNEILTRIDRAKVTPSLILCEDKVHFRDAANSVELRCLRAPVFPTPRAMAGLTAALRDLQPDVVHVWRAWASIAGRYAARWAGAARVIASVRRPRMPLDEALGERLARGAADHHVTNSAGIRDELVARAKVPEDAITVIENGVDLARFHPVSRGERAALRAALGLSAAPLLVVPARISPEKNQLGLVSALGALRRAGRLPKDLRVVLLGRDSLILYGRRVKAEISRLGLRDAVEMVPAVHDVERWLAAADYVAVPSHYEGLSNAVVESLSSGVPCLVTRAANADAVVRDGVDGVVAASPEPDDLASALARLFEVSDETRARYGASGRDHAEARFSVDGMVSRFEALYARVLDAPRRID